MFKGNIFFGSNELRELVKITKLEDWEFFVGSANNMKSFQKQASIETYREILKDSNYKQHDKMTDCTVWTIRDARTQFTRVIVTSCDLDLRDLFIRYKKSFAKLKESLSSLGKRIAMDLHASIENSFEALIMDNFVGFEVKSERKPMLYKRIGVYSRDINIKYLKLWLESRGAL